MLEGRSWSGNERNRAFVNIAGRFVDAMGCVGFGSRLDGRGLAIGDLDRDGDPDVVVSNRNRRHVTILRNDSPGGHHFLVVALQGTSSNRMGVGARLSLSSCGAEQLREVALGSGFVSQSAMETYFGLGSCSEPVDLTVSWPGRRRSQRFEALPVDTRLHVTEGSASVRLLSLAERRSRSRTATGDKADSREAAVRPEGAVAWSEWTLPIVEGGWFSGGSLTEGLTLLTFWARWCAACRDEIRDLSIAVVKLRALGLEIVGVSIDSDLQTARRTVEEAGVSFVTLHDSDLTVFERYSRLARQEQPAIPLSVLVEDGVIRRVFEGPIDVQTLVGMLESPDRIAAGLD